MVLNCSLTATNPTNPKKMKQKNNTIWIILAIIGLFIILKHGGIETFSVLYYGQQLEGYTTNITGECWTLGTDTCVKQTVRLINLTKQNILICPEGYYSTKLECEKAFELIKEPEKHMCYRINEEKNICEEAGMKVVCGEGEFTSLSACQAELEKRKTTLTEFITQPYTLVVIILALVAVIGLIISQFRK